MTTLCSTFSQHFTLRGCRYTLNYADEIGKFEDKVEDKGVTVVIEPKVC